MDNTEIPTLVDSSLSPDHLSPPSDDDLPNPPPSDLDLRARIIKQVEYYFSDENLPNDKFLMKQLKKDKQGFVSISLIASFRKMKKLTKDSSLIVDALKESSQLVVSSDGKKVKRLHPLPSMKDNNPKLCTVVVENLPEDHSLQNIEKICSQVGSVRRISINGPYPPKDLKESNKAEKPVQGKVFAVVEYEKAEAAEKAVATLNDETDWRNGLRVVPYKNRKEYFRKRTCRGSDTEKGSHPQLTVAAKDQNNNHPNDQDCKALDKDEEHTSTDNHARKGRNRYKGQKHHGYNGMGHGIGSIVEPSKPPPGPRMPDGTKGFTMGRGRALISSHI